MLPAKFLKATTGPGAPASLSSRMVHAEGKSVPRPWVSVVFPAYQEEAFLERAVRDVAVGLRATGRPFEILIVENGSKDQTRAVADALADEFTEVQSLSVGEPNYGKALRHGLLTSTGEYVVNFDVDLYDLDFLRAAVARLGTDAKTGASVVVASKRGEDANDTRHWTRKVVTGVFSTLLRVGFGLKVSDTHGMKAMRRDDVAEIAERCVFGTDLFDTELILRAERSGLRTAEIGVTIAEMRPARTPIAGRIARSVKGLAILWWTLRAEAKRR
jgi:glycosyltransferase involved in cell wall biosynthesis